MVSRVGSLGLQAGENGGGQKRSVRSQRRFEFDEFSLGDNPSSEYVQIRF
jgi:hypothetical protein